MMEPSVKFRRYNVPLLFPQNSRRPRNPSWHSAVRSNGLNTGNAPTYVPVQMSYFLISFPTDVTMKADDSWNMHAVGGLKVLALLTGTKCINFEDMAKKSW